MHTARGMEQDLSLCRMPLLFCWMCLVCVCVSDVGWRAVDHCFARLSTLVRCGALSCGMILWTFCVPHSCDVFVLHFLLQIHPFCSQSMTCDYFGIYIYIWDKIHIYIFWWTANKMTMIFIYLPFCFSCDLFLGENFGFSVDSAMSTVLLCDKKNSLHLVAIRW